MTSKKKLMTGVIVAIVLIAAYFVIAQASKYQKTNVSSPDETNLKEVSCDVYVTNPRWVPLIKNGDLVIEAANCQQQYVNNCGRFSLFADTGTVRLSASGGLGSGTDVNIGEGSSQSYTLVWCGSKLTKDFKLELYNDNNEKLQTKEVKLQ